MNWLLDVNVLVALAHQGHAEHQRVIRWFAVEVGSDSKIATCAISELGFVRVSVQAGFENDVPGAVETLEGLKKTSRVPFELVTDGIGAKKLPSYVLGPKQITDGHLLELAKAKSIQLATLDKNIPGAYVIP
ncbi:hypothetical protein FEM03_16745 [Phragmitibacter flavus]|uniref:PIN domain-containing protein n=1 Tax=Phragmitibacter flavus TaxID=2576071 RepID=A0A5R8KBC9_9BACT|nr:PIN domain-containing protein [Phragmitibacter flavus]TLD69606.1 hypothetical protein FEM03_16745 [Phragmitibacter flavus]